MKLAKKVLSLHEATRKETLEKYVESIRAGMAQLKASGKGDQSDFLRDELLPNSNALVKASGKKEFGKLFDSLNKELLTLSTRTDALSKKLKANDKKVFDLLIDGFTKLHLLK